MELKTCSLLAVALIFTAVTGQTPPGTNPSTDNSLAVRYDSTTVTPGILLPRSTTLTIPTFSYTPLSTNQTYTLLLVDLSILPRGESTSSLDPTYQLPLAAGISPTRTTRLHYWQAGLTFTSNGTLLNTTSPIAYYQPPSPPAGDIPHTYVFYLFEQGAGFAPPPSDNPFNAANVNNAPTNRQSFSVQRLAAEPGVGPLVAGNYITVQNTTGVSTATGGTGTGSATGSATGLPPTGTGTAIVPTASPFVGEAGKADLRKVGGLVLAVGYGVAFLLA